MADIVIEWLNVAAYLSPAIICLGIAVHAMFDRL